MIRHLSRSARCVALALFAATLLPLHTATAQQGGAAAGAEPAAHKTAPDGKKILTLADYGPWKRITSAAISNDG
ncbi:MAG: hypothetical protein ABI338_03440, partial [Gemmatimonadaceae bacterium]